MRGMGGAVQLRTRAGVSFSQVTESDRHAAFMSRQRLMASRSRWYAAMDDVGAHSHVFPVHTIFIVLVAVVAHH